MSYNQFSRQAHTHEDWKLVDQFDSTYWSGLDVQIFANNILIDEAIQVSYAISEQTRPYYGYASYVPDRIYHGARLIQGELSLNFKRDGYLFSLLNLLRQQSNTNIWLPGRNYVGGDATIAETNPPLPYNNAPWGPQLWEQAKTEGVDPKVINAMITKYRSSREGKVYEYEPTVQERAGMFETKVDGFDINVVFGANLSAAHTLRYIDGDSYDVTLADGTKYPDGAVIQEKQGALASTGIKLIGVSIMGLARTINDDGRPIIETYSFHAKDIQILKNVDRSVNTSAHVLQSPIKRATNMAKEGLLGGNSGVPEELFPEWDVPPTSTLGD